MRTRLRRRLLIKKILTALFLSVSIPAAAGILVWSLPEISECAAAAGVISAGLVLPEGGLALLQGFADKEEPVSAAVPEKPEKTEELSAPEPLPEEPPALPESSVPPAPLPALPEEDPFIPEENRAALVHKTYTTAPSSIYIPLENGYIKNCTALDRAEIEKESKEPPAFSIAETSEPQVLIMHTHTTESYMPFRGDEYDKTTSFRSTDNQKNMAAVGERIVQELEAAGIGVLHDITQHDYPSYNGSYDRSRATVQQYLKKYPSIRVVLDIHRDAIASGDTVTAPVAEINGKTAAQIMIISGCDSGKGNYPEFRKNLRFASALQNRLESDHPGLTRPVLFDYRFYNQDLTTGSLLIEVGGHGNTLEQACYSGELIGKSLGALLKELKK